MTEPQQWRYQWPDGTWIRWNPQTQSWEKEDAGDTPPEDPPAQPELQTVTEVPPVEPEPEPTAEESAELIVEESASSVTTGADDPFYVPRRSTRRALVDDVLPPEDDVRTRGGSLWPAIITGLIVGVIVGLLIWNAIR